MCCSGGRSASRRAGSDFIMDIAVARDITNEPSLDAVKRQITSYLQTFEVQPNNDHTMQAGGLEGWMWDLPGQPEQSPRPRREPYRLAILYDPRGYEWVLAFSWSSPEAFKTYESVFDHALKTFRAK